MVNKEYFKKIKTNGNLHIAIIDFLSSSSIRPTSGSKMATYKRDMRTEYLLSKVNFPAK